MKAKSSTPAATGYRATRWKGVVAIMLLYAGTAEGGEYVVPVDVPLVELFEELNYELPTMEPVKAAVEAGDTARAKEQLLAHFRAREDAQERPSADLAYDRHLVDEMLEGRFIWGETLCTYGPQIEDIEWYKVPEGVYWPLFDHELGRHTFVTQLVEAYRKTGDEKYVRHLIALLMKFIRDCPVEDGRLMPQINNCDGRAARELGVDGLTTIGHPAMMWSQMVAMRRVQRWPDVLQYCIHSDAITPDALAILLTSIVEHERYLLDALDVCDYGNHGTRTGSTALEIAARLPEFRERDTWADRATADILKRYNWHDTNPLGFIFRDGATVEISPEVARGDYGELLRIQRWIRMLGREIPPQLVEIQEKMIEYLAYITWPTQLEGRRGAERSGPGLPGRGDLDFIEGGGRKGTPPERGSYPLRSGDACHAGTYFMRGDWSPQAVALRVRFGPIQYKYSQFGLGDVGDVGVWGYGSHLIPHMYHHPRIGPFSDYGDRSFCGDGRSENTISVDGVGQSSANRESPRTDNLIAPLATPWITTPVFDYVRGSYRFDEERIKAIHTRAILFVKPDYFLVFDRVDGSGKAHRFRMKYQLHEDLGIAVSGTRVVGEVDERPRVVVAPSRGDLTLTVVKGREKPTYEGWHLNGPESGVPAPALIYTWYEETPTTVETVLWPTPPGSDGELELSREVGEEGVMLTVRRGETVDMITMAGEDRIGLCRF
ncbi:MAG: heparinase II/III family protein, partial [Candidatus Latescibacteria bacterium]|nr:heparinase II/III family protein [Candidatus Latescibacterota bacterium]